jgi:hypothetical protein
LNKIKSHEQVFPSELFGIRIGLHTIYKNWILPEGETAELLANKLLKTIHHETIHYELYLKLLNLNPELSNIILIDELIHEYRYQPRNIYFHICFGVISKYTVRDINHFLLRCLLPNNEIYIYYVLMNKILLRNTYKLILNSAFNGQLVMKR